MKKILIFLLLISAFFAGCNSCTKMTKNLESNWGDPKAACSGAEVLDLF